MTTPLGCEEESWAVLLLPAVGVMAVGPWYATEVSWWVKQQEVTGGHWRVTSSWIRFGWREQT